ncbi:LysE family translocator [Spiribacter halobius]|uniref:Lysine transporter LysE n=1 Tax=Sediminicurvatus halobius TaxID=2182432 RepID=A0A2U2MXS1_9GAMM|nr:LysE family translocator [Spiribacter halobius]PWG61573.1 lysine transporter LysE [Spiribacter halobius]UEX77141.1 LysE family translocator [Spiribacter halobius]
MSLLLAMGGFAAAMSASPGPVNIITLTSGVTNGVRRTLPFVTGATIGFTCLLAAIGLGLSGLIDAYPAALQVLKYAGTLFILFMAWQLFRAGGALELGRRACPRFLEGFALQWLNPKAWLACVSGVSAFTTAGDYAALAVFCALYFVICFLGIGGWAVLGNAAVGLVRSERRMRWFNAAMGTLLVGVAAYLLLSEVPPPSATAL